MNKKEIQKNARGDLDKKLLEEAFSEWELDTYLFEQEEDVQYLGKSSWGIRLIHDSINGRMGDKCLSVITDKRILFLFYGESAAGDANEKVYENLYLPFQDIKDIEYNDGLTKSSITLQSTKDFEFGVEDLSGDKVLTGPKLKFRFRSSHSGANAKNISEYLQEKIRWPPKDPLDKRYERISEQAEKLVGPRFDIPAPDEFDDAEEAKNEYEQLLDELNEWKTVRQMYESVLAELNEFEDSNLFNFSLPKPDTFENTSLAKEEYGQIRYKIKQAERELDDILESLSESPQKRDALISIAEDLDKNLGDIIKEDLPTIPNVSEFENIEDAKNHYEEITKQIEQLHFIFESIDEYKEAYPDLPFDELLTEVIDTYLNNDGVDPERIETWYEITSHTVKILDFLSEVDTNHPSISAEEWRESISLALEEEFPNVLRPTQKQIEKMGSSLWEYNDFENYSWQEFEVLVGTLFESLGYDTEVTSETADMGIDVWANNEDARVAIQAKQYQRGNTVGRETLQKLSSTLAKGDADRIIVVTTSSFARTAEEWAKDFGPEIELIDGNKLVNMLNNSDLPAPK